MISLTQTARYLKLQSQCLISNHRQPAIVAYNAMTAESVKCIPLPSIDATTETYIKWVLALPLYLNHADSLALAKSIADMNVNQHEQIRQQRDTIRHAIN